MYNAKACGSGQLHVSVKAEFEDASLIFPCVNP